jgi:hypothetical protein
MIVNNVSIRDPAASAPIAGWCTIAVLLSLLTNSGCSVYMAAKQPDAKDLSVLKAGTHRGRVIAELGAPVWSGDKDGEKTDVFVFKHGYGAAARTGRAVFHGTADVFTLGLWEVVSTPTEAYFSGSDVKIEVAYDIKDLIRSTKDLTGQNPELDYKPPASEQKTEVMTESRPVSVPVASPSDSDKLEPGPGDQGDSGPPETKEPAS